MGKPDKRKKIMVVEDDPGMQEIYRSMLEDSTDIYDYEIFDDARKAFRRFERGGVDLVILDMIMEPMEGECFVALAKDDSALRNVPILVVSVISPDNLEHLKKLGNVRLLQKPVTKETLLNETASALA